MTIDRGSGSSNLPTWREEFAGRWPFELGILVVLIAGAAMYAPLGDPDLPLHLALGEWIVRHGAVPTVEPFAWTRDGDPFFAYSWLPEATFYIVYRTFGTFGVQVLQGAAAAASLAAMVTLARLARWSVWTGIVLVAAQATVMMLVAPYLRPQAMLFVVMPLAWGFALRLLGAQRPGPWAAGLLVLCATAANSHVLFPITAATWLLLAIRWPGGDRAAWLVGATVAGWLLTPYVFDWPAVFALNFGGNALFSYPTPVAELAPGAIAALSGRGTLLLIAAALCALPWLAQGFSARERVVWGVAWLAGLFAFAVAARAILLWWLLVLPFVGATIEPLARSPKRRVILLGQRLAIGALVLLLAVARLPASDAEWARDTGARRWVSSRAAPAVDPLAAWLECRMRDERRGRALTAFPYGAYLTWRLPALSYSIDSRNIFPDSVARAESYMLASRGPAPLGPWRSADLAIVPLGYRVAAVLDTAAGWRRAATTEGRSAAADGAGLWVRDSWWHEVSDSALQTPPPRLALGRAGLAAACR